MSKKDIIYDTLSRELDVPVAYLFTDTTEIPRVSFALVSNNSERLSNKRHEQRLIYQIDYMSDRPLDVETDITLNKIIEVLENENLILTDWMEEKVTDAESNRNLYFYWIEVE